MRAAVAVAVFFFALAGTSQAALRGGGTQDGLDNQRETPSLEPRPALLEVVSAAVEYDDATGTVRTSVTFNQPPGEFERLAATLTVADCRSGAQTPRLSVSVNGGSNPETTTAKLEGFDGTASGTSAVSADGRTILGTVTNSNFARRDYTCVAGESAATERADEFEFYFSGYDPQSLESKLPIRTVCNRGYDEDDDYAGIYRAFVKPKSCYLTRDTYASYQSANYIKARYRRWGETTAYADATLTGNMGYRRRVTVKLYALRPDCTGRYRVYTRMQFLTRGGKRLGPPLKPTVCPTE